jgi:hypothetical protein
VGIKSLSVPKTFKFRNPFTRIWVLRKESFSEKMSLFISDGLSFYLQDYYVKEGLDNTMVLLEVDNADSFYKHLEELELDKKYQNSKVIPVQQNDWW